MKEKNEDTLANRLSVKKEAVELSRACGYVAGEVHEVTKDGVGMEDVKSVLDIAKNYEILKDGFDIKVKMNKRNLEQLSQADLIEIVLATFEGFKKGKQ